MNEKEIIKLYTKESKSTYEIAEIMATYPNKIRRILIKNGIDIKTKSEAQKNALKSGKAKIPTKGKKRSIQERVKISTGLKNRWNNITEEEYNKHVESAKKRWDKLTVAEKNAMNQAAIKAIQRAGKEGSKLEKFLHESLTDDGHVVETHKKNLIPNENLEIDMYLPELGAIIEVDGPSHFLPIWGEEKLKKQIKADENKTGLILGKGLVIVRIKSMSDSVSLSDKHKLKDKVLDILKTIKDNYPKESKRYIEIEI